MDASQPPRLLDQVRRELRTRHYSFRTEKSYVGGIRRFILFHRKRHPREMGGPEVEAFLSYLAVSRNVAAATQNQALNAILFLCREVLGMELRWLANVRRAKKPKRLPTVLTRAGARSLLAQLEGTPWLIASLLYGAGLRLTECLRLRAKDVDFAMRTITVRDGKGAKDRVTVLPETVIAPLGAHLDKVRVIHEQDLAKGLGRVYLPFALARKYPGAVVAWGWQLIFPAGGYTTDPATSSLVREALNNRYAVIASTAKQSRMPATPRFLDCFVASLLAMTALIRGSLDFSFTRRLSSAGSSRQSETRTSRNRHPAIRCVTPSRRIFSRMERTYAPSRNCSDTRMYRQP